MTRIFVPVLAIVAVFLTAAFLRYGTISPCGALKQRLKREVISSVEDTSNTWEELGQVIGVTVAGKMVDTAVDSRTPLECVKGLYRLETQGGGATPRAKGGATQAKLDVDMLAAGIDLFHLELGRYPTSSEGLTVLIEPPEDEAIWDGPYLKHRKLPRDPWGNDYRYEHPGRSGSFDVCSYGADGRIGGQGADRDICTWN